MNEGIIDLEGWFETPAGRYLLAWEQQQYDQSVADIFGYHALQLGLPTLRALAANRMPHRWLATTSQSAALEGASEGVLCTDYAALPFPEGSLDLAALPHTLDSHPNPHGVLREVARVLMPGGRVVISGLNPASLWGLRRRRDRLFQRLDIAAPLLPQELNFIGHWRLRDWLHLLDFEVEVSEHGAYRPLLGTEKWLHRWRWMDRAGARWWPFFGAAYFVVAVKRVHGVRLLGPAWKKANGKAGVAAPVVRRHSDHPNHLTSGMHE